jgi:hypothetical protein
MYHNDYLPQATDVFRQWVINFFIVLSGIYASLGIDKDTYDTLEKKKKIWDAADDAAGNPLTSTAIAKHERRRMRKEFSKQIRAFISEYIAHNHRLTPLMREELGIIAAATHSRTLSSAPYVEIIINMSGHITVHCRSSQTRWGMDAGAQGFEWRWVVSETPPETYEEFTHSEFSTRAHYTKAFDYCLRGKKIYSIFRWQNARGEKGPWSIIIETIIP